MIWNETDDSDDGPYNQVFGDVECAILRSVDDDDVFELARLSAGTFVDHADDRYVEIDVSIPDNEREDSSAQIEITTYLSIAAAKQFMGVLQQAIDGAEREHQRRADEKSGRRRKSKAAKTALAPKNNVPAVEDKKKNADARWDKSLKWAPTPDAAVDAAPAPKQSAKPKVDRKRRSALAATLRETQTGRT